MDLNESAALDVPASTIDGTAFRLWLSNIRNSDAPAPHITALIAHIDAHTAAAVAQATKEATQRADNAEGMAECMYMFRHDMIGAGVIGESVPPMFMSEAILGAIGGKQAEIDRLMLEYCPAAMSAEQMATWEASQRVVPDSMRTTQTITVYKLEKQPDLSTPSPVMTYAAEKIAGEINAAPQQHAQAAQFPPRDTSKPAEQQGIFEKFRVQRTDGSDAPGGKHHGCKYFVIDLDHDQYARAAMRAYAAACRATHPLLADDIEVEWGVADSRVTGNARAVLSDERGAFEKYYRENNPRIATWRQTENLGRNSDGDYFIHPIPALWAAWQARAILAARQPAPGKTEGCAGFQGKAVTDCGPCGGAGCDPVAPVAAAVAHPVPSYWPAIQAWASTPPDSMYKQEYADAVETAISAWHAARPPADAAPVDAKAELVRSGLSLMVELKKVKDEHAKMLQDVSSALLWMHRRLPLAYKPFAGLYATIESVGSAIGHDAMEALAEKAAQGDALSQQAAKRTLIEIDADIANGGGLGRMDRMLKERAALLDEPLFQQGRAAGIEEAAAEVKSKYPHWDGVVAAIRALNKGG